MEAGANQGALKIVRERQLAAQDNDEPVAPGVGWTRALSCYRRGTALTGGQGVQPALHEDRLRGYTQVSDEEAPC